MENEKTFNLSANNIYNSINTDHSLIRSVNKYLSEIAVLWKKEAKAFFTAPLPYMLSAFFIFILAWTFFQTLVISKENYSATLTLAVIRPIFSNINFLFLIIAPLLTMRTFAEEKKEHTLEMLLTSNLSELQIVLGKFAGLITITIFMLTLTSIYPIILAVAGYHDLPVLLSSYCGTILNTAAYLALGMFISSLTENQIISAMITFISLAFLTTLSQAEIYLNNFLVAQILSYLSLIEHLGPFTRGVISTVDITYYISFIVYLLFLTQKSLQTQRY